MAWCAVVGMYNHSANVMCIKVPWEQVYSTYRIKIIYGNHYEGEAITMSLILSVSTEDMFKDLSPT